MSRYFRTILWGITLLITNLTYSQVKFYAVCNADEIILGSYFNVEFVIENGSHLDFVPPDFKGFQVISGPNRSSQISIINGQRSQKEAYGYSLIPEKTGNLIIGSAKIRVGKKSYKSQPLTVKVLKSAKGSRSSTPEKDVFVKAELVEQNVYFGQQVLLNYVLYTRKRISGYNVLALPDFEGMLAQETEIARTSGRKVVGGKEYTTEVLKSFALIPQKTGKITVEPLQLTLGLAENDDPFGIFRESKPMAVSTNEVVINVLPLPDHPSGSFNGGVGDYSISTEVTPLEVTTDDAVSLQLTITGNGLSKYIQAQKLDFGEEFEVYDPTEVSSQDFVREGYITGSKTFEYLLVPLQTGKKTIQLSYDYFDPEKKQYVTLNSPEYRISVAKGKKTPSARRDTPGNADTRNVLPLMTGRDLIDSADPFAGSMLFWILLALLILAIPVMFWYKKHLDKTNLIDPLIRKSQKASKEAKKRLAKARSDLNAGNHQAFYKSISEALLSYAADKFSIETLDLSKSRIESALKEKSVPDEHCLQFNGLLEKCERALFAGFNPQGDENLYNEAVELIANLETHINKVVQDEAEKG
jgi:hypothetical protein